MKSFLMICLLTLPLSVIADSSDCYDVRVSNATMQLLPSQQVLRQDFTISRKQSTSCTHYQVFFSKGLGNSYQRRAFSSQNTSIDYNLHSNINMSGILKDYGDAANSAEWLNGSLPQEDTYQSNGFYISLPGLPAQGNPAAGIYMDQVQLSFYRVTGSLKLQTTKTFTVFISVSSQIDISLVEEGGSHNSSSTSRTLNFGNLEKGLQLGSDLMVESNTPYQVRASSVNNGAMKNGNALVQYILRSNGTPINMNSSAGSPVTIASGSPTGRGIPARYNLKVEIATATENLPAGIYQDVITITAMAN